MTYNHKILEVMEAVLNGTLGIIDASRRIVRLRVELRLFETDVLNLFRAIDSQTDHLILNTENIPMSDARKEENIREIGDYESFYRAEVERECRYILSQTTFED